MFVNYFKERRRATSFNIFIVRVLLGVYGIWKALSYDFERLREWPEFLFAQNYHAIDILVSLQLDFVWIEKWIIVALFVLFVFGWRTGFVTFFLAAFITHVGALHYSVTNSGATWMPVIYILILFGLYRETDVLSVDGYRRTSSMPQGELNAVLKRGDDSPLYMGFLMWTLIIFAATYFFTGYSKILFAGVSWLEMGHLPVQLQVEAIRHLNEVPPTAQFLIDHQIIAWISSWLTIVFECGFLIFVLLRLPIWPFIIGLAGLHAMILLTMNIFFFDQYLLYLAFIPWDRLHVSAEGRSPLKVVYDDTCNFCARALTVLRHVDTGNVVRFVAPGDAREEIDRIPDDVDFTKEMYAFRNGEVYRGHYAFIEVLRTNYVLRPLAWLLKLPPVAWAGERVYDYIARNRHALSTSCEVSQNGDGGEE